MVQHYTPQSRSRNWYKKHKFLVSNFDATLCKVLCKLAVGLQANVYKYKRKHVTNHVRHVRFFWKFII